MLVRGLVVVELKSIETVMPVHRGQVLSYLRLGGFGPGFLLNFNVAHMRDGITRLVNSLWDFWRAKRAELSSASSAHPPRPLR